MQSHAPWPRPAPTRAAPLAVTVLSGGPGAEREVSLSSGTAVADALQRRGHSVLLADIGPHDLSALDRACDVVFPALHGTFGEDGQLQRILEARGIRFVGSGSAASEAAMDKAVTKRLAQSIGVRTPAFEVVERGGEVGWNGPVVVKPVDQGSSVMTRVVTEPTGLAPAVAAVLDGYGRALVERFIAGDELTVGILAGVPLPPICIRPRGAFYDYDAKYRDDRTEYHFDSHPPALLDEAARLSLRVFQRLGCRHLARVDWMVDREQNLWLLEVNTLPGFTSHSLLPKAAERVGVPFDELCHRLVVLACEDGS